MDEETRTQTIIIKHLGKSWHYLDYLNRNRGNSESIKNLTWLRSENSSLPRVEVNTCCVRFPSGRVEVFPPSSVTFKR